MGKLKQFTRPPKKPKAKNVTPETVEDFQQAADLEEDTSGKWRAGDVAKSSRAVVRALDIYDKGLQKHPHSFDLAYNKARLQLDTTQRPPLVAHIGLPVVELLRQTLDSHRFALALDNGNPDVLFNTAQVLTSLAENLAEAGDSSNAVPLLQEALELLSTCLSRQESIIEQHNADFAEVQDSEDGGGVPVDADEKPGSIHSSDFEEQSVTIETPITAVDLMDTVLASIAAMTTLAPFAQPSTLQSLGDMARSLMESKTPGYVAMLPLTEQEEVLFETRLAQARFIAALADAQYNSTMIDLKAYCVRLNAFDIPGRDKSSTALGSEAEARTELVLSVIALFGESPDLPADVCWKQLSSAQDLYSKAAKLEPTSRIYLSRGDVEMLRHRLAATTTIEVSDGIRKNAPTLAQNAQTHYKGAMKLATDDDADVKTKAEQMMWLVQFMRASMYGVDIDSSQIESRHQSLTRSQLDQTLVKCVDEGLIESAVAIQITRRLGAD